MNKRDSTRPAKPYTVFKPTTVAFARMPPGVMKALQRPENRSELARLLAYHVLPERMNFPALRAAIMAGGGLAILRTICGGTLAAILHSPVTIGLRDEQGGLATLSATDIPVAHGITHIVDRVLMPRAAGPSRWPIARRSFATSAFVQSDEWSQVEGIVSAVM